MSTLTQENRKIITYENQGVTREVKQYQEEIKTIKGNQTISRISRTDN
ncbi:MAG: hypothetical protein AB8U25_06170 [Rickettsiales endosymbiont of Dermacentor nuttalli]